MDIKEALNTIAEMCNALNLNPNSKQGQAMLMAIDALKEKEERLAQLRVNLKVTKITKHQSDFSDLQED